MKTASIKVRRGNRESRNEYIRRVWAEAREECEKPRLDGVCAKCGRGPMLVLPYMKLPNGETIPLDKKHKDYPRSILTAEGVCKCCSYPGCGCRTAREQQMDRALAVTDGGGDWKKAVAAAKLYESRDSELLIEFWKANRRLETPSEYMARVERVRAEKARPRRSA